jgi:hypothetical protein
MFTPRRFAIALLVSLATMVAPAGASALTSTVNGTVGAELSLAIATPAVMTLTHGTPGSSSSVVTVTSTNASWTLTVSDASGSSQPGHMNKVGAPTVFLQDALQWSSNSGATWNSLSGTAATVGTGALLGTKTVTYQQALASGEGAAAGDSYNITVTYTAS